MKWHKKRTIIAGGTWKLKKIFWYVCLSREDAMRNLCVFTILSVRSVQGTSSPPSGLTIFEVSAMKQYVIVRHKQTFEKSASDLL